MASREVGVKTTANFLIINERLLRLHIFTDILDTNYILQSVTKEQWFSTLVNATKVDNFVKKFTFDFSEWWENEITKVKLTQNPADRNNESTSQYN